MALRMKGRCTMNLPAAGTCNRRADEQAASMAASFVLAAMLHMPPYRQATWRGGSPLPWQHSTIQAPPVRRAP